MRLKRWIFRCALIGFVGYIGYSTFNTYRGGFFSLPDLPDGAYPISFNNGFRAIVLDPEGADPMMNDTSKHFRRLSLANRDRRYLGFPYDVQPWFQDAWSWCRRPTDAEKASIDTMPDDFKRQVESARFEAVCTIDVDGKSIVRGLIFSVPRL